MPLTVTAKFSILDVCGVLATPLTEFINHLIALLLKLRRAKKIICNYHLAQKYVIRFA